VPVASDDEWQSVGAPELDTEGSINRDPATGNRMFHASLPSGPERTVNIRQRITRRARQAPAPDLNAKYGEHDHDSLSEFLKPNARVALDPTLARQAAGLFEQLAPVEACKRLFKHLLYEFDYDRGGCTPERAAHLGDLGQACDMKRGTCTEFHGLYTGAARAMGVPTKMSFGFNIPANADVLNGMIGGYHCWAESYLPQVGWFPLDITEAWKRKESGDPWFYFGALDENRVQFTTGRDVALYPAASQGPIDRFIFPVSDSAGEPVDVFPELRFESVA
jgi:transglutaminase-like putative cysteine protease